MKNVVENVEIIEEILKECNWWEKIAIKMNKKLFFKIYHIVRIYIFNNMSK